VKDLSLHKTGDQAVSGTGVHGNILLVKSNSWPTHIHEYKLPVHVHADQMSA